MTVIFCRPGHFRVIREDGYLKLQVASSIGWRAPVVPLAERTRKRKRSKP